MGRLRSFGWLALLALAVGAVLPAPVHALAGGKAAPGGSPFPIGAAAPRGGAAPGGPVAPPGAAAPGGTGRAALDAPRYPVVFLPGLGGSELWNGDELVWLDPLRGAAAQVPVLEWFTAGWLMPLRLKPDGATPYRPEYRIRTGDVLRSGVVGIYGSFLDRLADLGYREGQDLFVYPYDWRKGIGEAAAGLHGVVQAALERNPGAGGVILVGHSMGALVARDYIRRTQGAGVQALIAVGAPWLGAPMAYKALVRGWDLGLRIPGTPWRLVAPRTVHLLAQDWPAVYALLPGRGYQDLYGAFVRRGGQGLSWTEARDQAVRPHNPTLTAAHMGYVDTLLDGRHYGVCQYLLAGTGEPTLVAAEEGEWMGFPTWDEELADGDDTVPRLSADLGASRDPTLPARWLGPVAGVAHVRGQHAFLLANRGVQEQVVRWLASAQAARCR